jgi:hypothetical protein
MRLAFGRGVHLEEIERRFVVSASALNKRKRKEGWTNLMLEGGRRELAYFVWHAGMRGGTPETEEERAHLLWASEWRRVARTPAWTPDAAWSVADKSLAPRAERAVGKQEECERDGCEQDGREGDEDERISKEQQADFDRAVATLEQLAERVERQIADEQARGNPDVGGASEGGAGGGDA